MNKKIDGAAVIYYTEPNNFGYVEYEDGALLQIQRLAICRYDQEDQYYVFACDSEFNVLGDTVHSSVEDAMKFATYYYRPDEIVWINA